jgi:hypothetical protein
VLNKVLRRKSYGGMELKRHVFLISAPDRDEWSTSSPGRFHPWERAPGTRLIGHGGGGGAHRAGPDAVAKSKFPTPVGNRTPIVHAIA